MIDWTMILGGCMGIAFIAAWMLVLHWWERRDERRSHSWIRTFTGKSVFPLRLRGDDLDLRDIAHSLSLQCRFNGHVGRFYSVAEHSVRVAKTLDARRYDGEAVKWGLMHDAAEAYLSDLPSPIKRTLPAYDRAEKRAQRVIAERYGLTWPIPKVVVRDDMCLCTTEARDLMGAHSLDWPSWANPLPDPIEPWRPAVAERRFLAECRRLGIK